FVRAEYHELGERPSGESGRSLEEFLLSLRDPRFQAGRLDGRAVRISCQRYGHWHQLLQLLYDSQPYRTKRPSSVLLPSVDFPKLDVAGSSPSPALLFQ